MSALNQLRTAATGQGETKERSPFDHLRHILESNKGEFVKLLGTMQNAEAFVRVTLNAVLANPGLLEVSATKDGLKSLLSASMKAAQDGLLPDGREAVLNVYNSKITEGYGRDKTTRWVKIAQYLPMVGGLVKKLYASGEVTYIDAACVYELDRFTWKRGENPVLEHEPTPSDQPGSIIAAYAVVKLKNGEVKREVMFHRDIEAVRKASKAVDSEGNPTGPWKDWYDQQSIKSVLKRIYKQLPKVDAFERLADYDNDALGFAPAGAGLGSVVQAPGQQSPQAAIEHDPSPSLGQELQQGEGQLVGGGMEDGGDVNTLRTRDGAEDVDPPRGTPGDKIIGAITFDVMEQRLRAAGDAEIAALVLDEARGVLTKEENDQLAAIYTQLHEPAATPPAPSPSPKKK